MANFLTRETNPSKREIVDAINERLVKAKSLTAVLLTSNIADEISFKAMYGAILILDDILEELDHLFDQLDKPASG